MTVKLRDLIELPVATEESNNVDPVYDEDHALTAGIPVYGPYLLRLDGRNCS